MLYIGKQYGVSLTEQIWAVVTSHSASGDAIEHRQSNPCCHDTENRHREREDSHVLGIWTRIFVPATVVAPGPVFLVHHPGAPHRERYTLGHFQPQAGALLPFWPLWHAASSAFRFRHTPPEVCAG